MDLDVKCPRSRAFYPHPEAYKAALRIGFGAPVTSDLEPLIAAAPKCHETASMARHRRIPLGWVTQRDPGRTAAAEPKWPAATS